MNGKDVINALKRKKGVKTDEQLRKALGLSGMTLHNWRTKEFTPRIVAEHLYRLASRQLSGEALVKALGKKLGTGSQTNLANRLGITYQGVQNFKKRSVVTPRQVAGLVKSASVSAENRMQSNAIRPVVEFFPIAKQMQQAQYLVFSDSGTGQTKHPYRSGLRVELEKHHGVYVFFDSRGQAIYAGKAKKQFLWKEINLAFNRKRYVQKIKRVKHPEQKRQYQTSDEKTRQIDEVSIPLYELAAYFSAYEVTDGMVGEVEALLVRSFANDLLNVRMEKFKRQKIKK
jgi:hypothetical protein